MKKRFLLLPLLLAAAAMARGQGEVTFSEGYFDYRIDNDDYVTIYQGAATLPSDLYVPSQVSHDSKVYNVRSFYVEGTHPEVTAIHFPASIYRPTSLSFPNLLNYYCEERPEGSRYQAIDGVLVDMSDGTLYGWPKGRRGAYTIPEGVKRIDYHDVNFNGVTSLALPSTFAEYSSRLYYAESMESVTVADGNEHFTTVDGMLLSKDGTTLHFCPKTKKVVFVPQTVTWMESAKSNSYWVMSSATPPGNAYSISSDWGTYVPSAYLEAYQGWGRVRPYDAIIDSLAYAKTSNESVMLTGCFSFQDNLVIPDEVSIDGHQYRVTAIGDRACYSNGRYNSITLPLYLDSIGDYAFRTYRLIVRGREDFQWGEHESTSVVYVTNKIIADDLVFDKIGDGKVALTNCLRSLSGEKMFIVPEQVQADGESFTVTQIGDNAFAYNLPTILQLPASIESIGENGLARRSWGSSCYIVMSGGTPPSIQSQSNRPIFLVKPEVYENYQNAEEWQSRTVYKYDAIVDDIIYTKLEDGGLQVNTVLSVPNNGILEIPSTVIVEGEELAVTQIGELWDRDQIYGRMIVLPETITQISSWWRAGLNNFWYVMLKAETPPSIDERSLVLVPSHVAEEYRSAGWEVLGVDGQTDDFVYGYVNGYYVNGVAIHAWLKEIEVVEDKHGATATIDIPPTIEDEYGWGMTITRLSQSLFENIYRDYSFDEVKFILPSISSIGSNALPFDRRITVFTTYDHIEVDDYGSISEESTFYGNRYVCESSPWRYFGTKVVCDAFDDQFVYANHYSEDTPADDYYYYGEPDGLSIVGMMSTDADNIVIPDEVVIGDYYRQPVVAIADSALRQSNAGYIMIPTNIKEIGIRALPIISDKYNVGIGVRASSEFFEMRDGVLLTKDGTTLVQCTPMGARELSGSWRGYMYGWREDEYTLNGVERILPGAFDGCDIDVLGLPASLKEICGDALSNAVVREMVVDENNENFCVLNGALLSKDLTRFVSFPCQSSYNNSMEELELPAEVQSIDDYAFGNTSEGGIRPRVLIVQSEVPPTASINSFGRPDYYLNKWDDYEYKYKKVPYYWIFSNTTLLVPAGTLEAYSSTEPWSNFENIISSTIDDEDFQLLKEFYAAMGNGDGWYKKWQFAETASETKALPGIRISDGHVTSIDLSNNYLSGTLSGELFRLPRLQSLNLSSNQLEGDISRIVPADVSDCPVTTLNLSHNLLTGNVGPVGEQLGNLTSLNVSYNHLTNVYPMLPTRITSLDLTNQTMDVQIDYAHLLDPIDPEGDLPSILFYEHWMQSYMTDKSFLLSSYDDDSYWGMYLQRQDYYLQPKAEYAHVYRLPEGTLVNLSSNGHSAKVSMKFDMGDVNFDSWLTIADLQSTVNHALDRSLGGLFNFTAANLIADEVVNVQDVVCLVNLLMDADESRQARRAPAVETATEAEADARLFWRGDELVLQTQREVGAIDLTLTGAEQVEWLPYGSEGYSHAMRRTGAGMHVIHYSMEGLRLAIGETVLARVAGSQPRIGLVTMVDGEAERIGVTISDAQQTGIADLADQLAVSANSLEAIVSTSRELTNVRWAAYDLSGTLLGQGSDLRWHAGRHCLPFNATAKGQVVVRLQSDEQRLTKKININQ